MIGMIAFSKTGMALGEMLRADLAEHGQEATLARCGKEGVSLSQWTAQMFPRAEALLFIGAVGIAVRAVAPHVRSKTTDPAVIAMDELGKFVIPLLSGHIGGANRLAAHLAQLCGGLAVITTATDINGVFAVDRWATENGLRLARFEQIKSVSSALLEGKNAWFTSDFPVEGDLPRGVTEGEGAPQIRVTDREKEGLLLIPPVLALGIGCRKGISAAALETQIAGWMKNAGLLMQAVCEVHTIDLKASEEGLLQFCEKQGWPISFHSAEELRRAEGDFTASAFVKSVTGVENVCERAAALAGKLILKKQAGGGVTLAAAEKPFVLRMEREKP